MHATNSLAQSYLQHILIATTAGDRSAPFRTFFDNWFAFKVAGPFLNTNSRPHWFNNPCPDKHGAALSRAHFVSAGAARTLAGIERQRLVKDHAIPVTVLRELLIRSEPESLSDVHAMMLDYYRIGIITQGEDELLRQAGLKSSMPDAWLVGDDPFARYRAVGILSQDLGRQGWAANAAGARTIRHPIAKIGL